MSKNVRIEENGKVVYDGPVRRGSDYNGDRKILFGMFTIKDVVQLCTVVVVITIFLIRAEGHIKNIEVLVISMTNDVKHLSDCQRKSDNYHSSVTGDEFECGKPVNAGNRTRTIREIINKESHADDR